MSGSTPLVAGWVSLVLGQAGCAGHSDARRSRAVDSSPRLRTNVAPGGNFDLSLWELQEPVGAPGRPTTIGPMGLRGPNGFQDGYFFTDSTDGAMTFWDPENGVTTPNSKYSRSELREMNADGSRANWPIAGVNTLSVTVAVTQVPDRVCIGQVHTGTPIRTGLTPSSRPLLELYYDRSGHLALGIEDGPEGGQTLHAVASVPPGRVFTYTIELQGRETIALVVDGAESTFTLPPRFDGYGAYFKAGAYDQSLGADAAIGARVKLYAIAVSHRR